MEKRHTIRMSSDTARRLKIMSATVGVPQGDLLSVLLTLAAKGELTDDQIAAAMTENFLRSRSFPMGGPR